MNAKCTSTYFQDQPDVHESLSTNNQSRGGAKRREDEEQERNKRFIEQVLSITLLLTSRSINQH